MKMNTWEYSGEVIALMGIVGSWHFGAGIIIWIAKLC